MTDFTDDERARKANGLLQNELFIEAFDVLKQDLLNRWSNSGSTEVEARVSIWLAMRLLDKIHALIKSIVETGNMNKILEKQHPFI